MRWPNRRFAALAAGHPNDAGVLNNLGNALIGLGRHEDALLCFQQVLGLAPVHAAAHYNMGRALAALDRPDEAVASFQAALSIVRPALIVIGSLIFMRG